MERGLDPARRRERDAVGRKLVPGPRRAVPAAHAVDVDGKRLWLVAIRALSL